MSDNIDFRVDYSKINVLDVFNGDNVKFPLVLSIPHCGTVFPDEFLKAVKPDVNTLRKNEDIFVYDLLKSAIDEAKITAVKLNLNRAFIDVNRAKVELDPNMFFDYPREDIGLNQQRSRYGLGIIHKVTADSLPIYAGKISHQINGEVFIYETSVIFISKQFAAEVIVYTNMFPFFIQAETSDTDKFLWTTSVIGNIPNKFILIKNTHTISACVV